MFRLYKSLGWSCFPLKPGTKVPKAGSWKQYQQAFPEDQEIDKWCQEFDGLQAGLPQIAIVTGSVSGIVVLDVDGEEGWQWLKQTHAHLPITVAATTSPGDESDPDNIKVHLYYQHPGGIVENKVKFRPGLDLRGDGGYVVAPPSLHPLGHRYEWQFDRGPGKVEIAPMPDWLLADCGRRGVTISEVDLLPPEKSIAVAGVCKGERNDTAARLAGHWYGCGLKEPEVWLLLSGWNAMNQPPLKELELRKVCHSIATREARKRASQVGSGELAANTEINQAIPWHERRQAMLSGLSKRLGIKVLDVQKITGEAPVWHFQFERGTSANMSTAQVFNNSAFRAKVWEQAGRNLEPISNKKNEWGKICQIISDVAEWVDAGEEATVLGATRVAIEDYLVSFRPEVWNEGNRPPLNYPFSHEVNTYIFAAHLLNYLQNNKGMKINVRELSQRLVALKFKNLRKRLVGFDLRVWTVPAKLVPKAPASGAKGSNVVPIKRI